MKRTFVTNGWAERFLDVCWIYSDCACCRVIQGGTVAEEGTHESLAEAGGLYSALVRSSFLPMNSASVGQHAVATI